MFHILISAFVFQDYADVCVALNRGVFIRADPPVLAGWEYEIYILPCSALALSCTSSCLFLVSQVGILNL